MKNAVIFAMALVFMVSCKKSHDESVEPSTVKVTSLWVSADSNGSVSDNSTKAFLFPESSISKIDYSKTEYSDYTVGCMRSSDKSLILSTYQGKCESGVLSISNIQPGKYLLMLVCGIPSYYTSKEIELTAGGLLTLTKTFTVDVSKPGFQTW